MISRIGLIGFGEVGQMLAGNLAHKTQIMVWDTALVDAASIPSLALEKYPVSAGASAPDAVRGAQLIISAVTAAQDLNAAHSAVPGLEPGAYFLDLNSCSPGQKQASARTVEDAGGRYVEAAVMSPVAPKGIATPMLLGGPHAVDFVSDAASLGFVGARPYSETIGRAAATKLCRSVIIKGVEALLTEAMLAAHHYGVERAVLESLSDLLPLPSWPDTAQYMISRALEHGARRAEEMREAALTVAEASLEPLMSQAIAEREDWASNYRSAIAPDLFDMLDALSRERARERPARASVS
jgi:3-hydroxyisobutyrate dehydrogenase-like beta-hydroxyacid dehydrogenase